MLEITVSGDVDCQKAIRTAVAGERSFRRWRDSGWRARAARL